MNVAEALTEVESYLGALRTLSDADQKSYLSCFELLVGLDQALERLFNVFEGDDTVRERHKDRFVVQFMAQILTSKDTYRSQISRPVLEEYIAQVEADYFSLRLTKTKSSLKNLDFRKLPFVIWLKKHRARIFAACLTILILTPATFYFSQDRREPVWRINYFSKTDFSGARFGPVEAPELRFDWGVGSPVSEQMWPSFSLRASSCIVIDGDVERLRFRIAADDGYRIFIDGRKIDDRWITQAAAWREISTELSGGWHLLEFHYFDEGGPASLKVELATDSRPEGAPDERLLRLPRVKRGGGLSCEFK